ncbi:DNA methyltransferase, partial [Escherichia coli]|uniref:DNA methyltransferase n=1 Tax=Escherichia coli TaxID=562 RepID=UPI0039BD5EDB
MKNTVKINSVDLINADCLHFIQSLPDDSIDLIVTDPPYFKVKPNGWDNQWKGDEDYLKWLDHCLAQFWRVLKPAGSLYLFCCQRQDYWPFFAIFNVRYWSLMLSAFRHFIITDWRGVF